MATAFISDLHLCSQRPELIKLFIKFTQEYAQKLDSLYILGDFFDVWVGDDALTEADQLVMQTLKSITHQGLSVYFMLGNRDFLMSKKFLAQRGIVYLKDPYLLINLYGNRLLLMHGDTLCTQDIAYQAYRKKVRNWFIQKIFLLKSIETRRAIAANYRKQSKKHTSMRTPESMDVTQEEVVRVMKKYSAELLIHGHTHRQAIHTVTVNNQTVKRIVLPAWEDEKGGALILTGKNEYHWLTIS